MKVPFSWLKQFVEISIDAKEVAKTLTMLGIEVEKIEETPLSFNGVVVGKVVKAIQHPNADRLRVATVTDGTEEYQVVCGAPNCREGIVVAFARIGASLTDPEGKTWKIKKSKLRDVESHGMLCSAVELGLGKESHGIVELSHDWPVGADLALFYADPIFELSLTPNLGHDLSILGIAREVAAALNLKVKYPDSTVKETLGTTIGQIVHASVKNPDLCPRYMCRALQNVKVAPSPEWLTTRLSNCGMRSINSVVDVANYVMLELGQPLHVFDGDKIDGKKIVVTTSTEPVGIVTLDNKAREIPPNTLVISDGKGPIAIAGIIGGVDSAATEKTTTVVIEAAQFSPALIRKTTRFLDLKTESSQRFDKGIDPEAVAIALDRAAFLIQQIGGGQIVKGMIDVRSGITRPKRVSLRINRVNQILGTKLGLSEIASLLERLEMAVETNGETLTVTIPTYRNDISLEIDLIEEVARIFGYDNLPKQTPSYHASSLLDAPIYTFERKVSSHLLNEGLQECITCDLISPSLSDLTLEKGLSPEAVISVLHPRSLDQSLLRTSLLPGLLQTVKNNQNFGVKEVHAFEVGRIHFKEGNDFKEQSCVGVILSGSVTLPSWDVKPTRFDFFDLKGVVENLAAAFGIEKLRFEPSHLHTLHPWRQARIKVGEVSVGVVGEIHPKILHIFDLKERAVFAELNLHDLYPLRKKEKKMAPLPPFPGSDRDWTLSLKESVPMDHVFHAIESFKSPYLEGYSLLDLYKSDQIGKDRKNATFRFVYRDKNKTIDVETVEREHQKLIQAVAEKLRDSIT